MLSVFIRIKNMCCQRHRLPFRSYETPSNVPCPLFLVIAHYPGLLTQDRSIVHLRNPVQVNPRLKVQSVHLLSLFEPRLSNTRRIIQNNSAFHTRSLKRAHRSNKGPMSRIGCHKLSDILIPSLYVVPLQPNLFFYTTFMNIMTRSERQSTVGGMTL